MTVGVLRTERLTCRGADHLPGCHNSWQDRTWCVCGAVSWPGRRGTWHSRPVRENWPHGSGRVLAWDTYYLEWSA